jgi:hypothetical protein
MLLMNKRCSLCFDDEVHALQRLVQLRRISFGNAVRVPRQFPLCKYQVMQWSCATGNRIGVFHKQIAMPIESHKSPF